MIPYTLFGIGVGIAVAFFCMFFYRRGVADGRAIKHDESLPKIVESKTNEEVEEDELFKEISAMVAHQPKHTEVR